MSDKQRIAALEAALKHIQHVLSEKQENGRLQPATVRASMARIAVEKALEGGTWSLDEMLVEKNRELQAKYDDLLGEWNRAHGGE